MKKISSRFSIAVHILTLISIFDKSCTSEFIASSVNTNAVLIRRIIGYLKKAELVTVHAGTGGTYLLKDISEITLLHVYNAVEVTEDNKLFNFHNSNEKCKIGYNIECVLGKTLKDAQIALENELNKVTIKDIVDEINAIP